MNLKIENEIQARLVEYEQQDKALLEYWEKAEPGNPHKRHSVWEWLDCVLLDLAKLTEVEHELILWKERCARNSACYTEAVRAQDNQRLDILSLKAKLAEVEQQRDAFRKALEQIAGYDDKVKHPGICDYGCDAPDIAQRALATTPPKGEA